jgi:hypothetical protein
MNKGVLNKLAGAVIWLFGDNNADVRNVVNDRCVVECAMVR